MNIMTIFKIIISFPNKYKNGWKYEETGRKAWRSGAIRYFSNSTPKPQNI